mmetsp:Transcript_94680/g.306243  ORF Transcript_94680/g.306243 Transcript_94680/m.306243 type:complete len:217 (-) Transcript_94680:868-1518(-)
MCSGPAGAPTTAPNRSEPAGTLSRDLQLHAHGAQGVCEGLTAHGGHGRLEARAGLVVRLQALDDHGCEGASGQHREPEAWVVLALQLCRRGHAATPRDAEAAGNGHTGRLEAVQHQLPSARHQGWVERVAELHDRRRGVRQRQEERHQKAAGDAANRRNEPVQRHQPIGQAGHPLPVHEPAVALLRGSAVHHVDVDGCHEVREAELPCKAGISRAH